MATPPTTFPVAEGLGIFVGIVSWDLLADGRMEIMRAVLIAGCCSLAWFGLRCWKEKTRNRRH
ncbi:hypothetical protein [Propionivibrio sp.]|uniref:hypothetical protein n=1 Tax=Propionivibrio sp. TaxID=2212460 RepID=UPI003BF010FA